MKPTLEAIEAGMTMQTSDLQKQMLDVVKSNPEKYKEFRDALEEAKNLLKD